MAEPLGFSDRLGKLIVEAQIQHLPGQQHGGEPTEVKRLCLDTAPAARVVSLLDAAITGGMRESLLTLQFKGYGCFVLVE